MNKLKAKKDVKIIETSNIEEAYGMYLYRRVLRVWHEDFIDEDNGAIIPIERTEPVAEIGEKVVDDVSQRLDFLLQTGDLKSIVVCNQVRAASEMRKGLLYQATIEHDGKSSSLLFYAYDATSAVQILIDYSEQTYEGKFIIKSFKTFGIVRIFVDRCPYSEMAIDYERAYIRGDMTTENYMKWSIPSEFEFVDEPEDTQFKRSRRFYYIEFDDLVQHGSLHSEKDFHDRQVAIVNTYSAERAQNLMNAFVEAEDRERGDDVRHLLSIEYSKPLNVTAFIPISFSKQVAGEL